jgi:hypothetical protein
MSQVDMSPANLYPRMRDPIIGLFVQRWKWSDTKIIIFFSGLLAFIAIGAGGVASSMYTGAGERISSLSNVGFLLIWIFFFMPMLVGMYLWQIRAASSLFEMLEENKVIVESHSHDRSRVQQIRQTLFQRLTKLDIYLLVFAFIGISLYYELTTGWPQQFKLVTQYWYEVKWYLPLYIIFGWSLPLYMEGIIMVRQWIIVSTLSNFIESADLQLEILHPDSVGGLGVLGEFIRKSSLFAMGLGIMAATYALDVSFSGSPILERLDVGGFFIIYLILLPLCLIFPLISSQKSMRKARNKILEPIALEFQATLRAAYPKVTEISTTEIRELNERLEQLQKHRDLILHNFPVSPIQTNALRAFSISAMLPLISGIISIALQILGK